MCEVHSIIAGDMGTVWVAGGCGPPVDIGALTALCREDWYSPTKKVSELKHPHPYETLSEASSSCPVNEIFGDKTWQWMFW